ncbi:MAG: tetratricopeptide repeat protein, partial [Candidatus Heimdallarchaeota archaeon]
MSNQGNDFEELIKLGERAIELHEDDKAISYFEQAIKLNKKSCIPFCHIGNIYMALGKIDNAKKYYE